jgi:hypothetical protein
MCDGYYWPMSTEKDRGQLSRDAKTCQSGCRSEARLFVLPEGSDDVAAATDLTGRAYGQLATAFAYRKALRPGCGCQPSPWSAESQYRHAAYAIDDADREEPRAEPTKPLPPLAEILAVFDRHRQALAATPPTDEAPPAAPVAASVSPEPAPQVATGTLPDPSPPPTPQVLAEAAPSQPEPTSTTSVSETLADADAVASEPDAAPQARPSPRQMVRVQRARSAAHRMPKRGLFAW